MHQKRNNKCVRWKIHPLIFLHFSYHFFFQISEFNEQKSMVQSRTGIINGKHKHTITVWAIPLQSRIVKFMNC